MIDSLCQRYSCLPSQLLKEDTSMLYRLALISMAGGDQTPAKAKAKAHGPSMPDYEDLLANISTALPEGELIG